MSFMRGDGSKGGFGHPTCLNNPTPAAVSGLPAAQ
jgi:hypothetical protein